MRNVWWTMVLGAAALTGCAPGDAGEIEDGIDDGFADGKADAPVAEGSAEACAVRKLVNLADVDTLDDDVGLSSLAARNLAAFRDGVDGARDTDDDGWYATLEDVDDIKYVGPATLRAMLRYVGRHDEYTCGPVDVQLLAFNDLHGALKPPTGSTGSVKTGPAATDLTPAGGAEYLATHLATLAATNPNTTIVAAGDIVGATPLLSAAFHDEPTIEAANLMRLAVTSVGNHEFDHGAEELLRQQYGGCHPDDGCLDGDGFAGAEFAYLAANVIDEDTEETLLPATAIRHHGNARIGFIGLTLEGTPLVTTAAGVAGLRFEDEAATINALVPELQAQGVHAIVVLIHEGGAQTGLYNECLAASGPILQIVEQLNPAVKVVVTGHTHNAYNCAIGDRLVTSAASNGRIVTDIDLTIDERTGAITAQTARNVVVTRDVARDAGQTALIARYEALVAPIANRVVGSIAGDLTKPATAEDETTMGSVIADAQLAAGRADGAVLAVMNPGGVRAELLAATISGGEQPGQVTHGEAFAVQPFANNLIVLTVTGAQLETMLEQQWTPSKTNMLQVSAGFTYAYAASAPIGDKVDPASIRVDGVVVDPAASYRIVANAFLADGGDGFAVLRQGTDRRASVVDLEALEAYLAAHPGLAVPALDRVTRLP